MNAKVLFVDDDEGNLVVCEAHCSGEFDVLTARDAEAALSQLRHDEEIGVIVADQRMPGASGVELLEQVKEEFPDVVRILITAYSDLAAAIAAINRGQVRRYLKKPWQPEELKAELRDALDVHQMSRKLRALGTRLRETERVYALGIIAAGVGHELKNPISWLHGSLEMLKNHSQAIERILLESPLRPAADPHLAKIRSSLENAEGGVDRLFEIVRGISMPLTSQSMSDELVDVEEVLGVTLRLVARELRDTARVEKQVTERPMVRGSATKVSQVFLNLIVNAVQALSSRPAAENRIRLSLTKSAECVTFEVADNGAGIPEQDWDRVFDPFFTTKVDGGTGLGLAICRQIALELGGTLHAMRDEQLGGALFRLRLPAAPQ